jgi:hypothetical protein
MKSLTKQDVKDAAVKLMEEHDSTTTLDVKNALRAEGFWATQNQVSEIMDEIYSEENWDYANPNGYREYFMDNDPFQFTKFDDDEHDDGNYVTRDGDVVAPIDEDNIQSDDWECYDASENKDEMYFSGRFSRDQVRCAYRFYTGLHFNDTRSRRLD